MSRSSYSGYSRTLDWKKNIRSDDAGTQIVEYTDHQGVVGAPDRPAADGIHLLVVEVDHDDRRIDRTLSAEPKLHVHEVVFKRLIERYQQDGEDEPGEHDAEGEGPRVPWGM